MTHVSISQLCRELRPLVPPQTPISGIYMAVGPRSLPAWFLRQLAPALGGGMPAFWIDAGNNFDAYGLSRSARELGFDPKKSLRCIQLARPFNAFQLETIVSSKLPPIWRGEPIVLSDPLAPLLDEETPADQAWKALPRILAAMRRLPAVWLALCVRREVTPERRGMLVEFMRHGCAFAQLDAPSWTLRPLARGALNLDQACALRSLLQPV